MQGENNENSYITCAGEGRSETVITKSRFLGYVFPVSTKEEADGLIASVRSAHPQARHTVYAYVLRENNYSRYSDDGEPQGTAGMPVLDVIKRQGVTDCLIAVVRYFGGVLLGTGGLVRAYSSAAAEALTDAGTATMKNCRRYTVSCDYSLYGKIIAAVNAGGGTVENTLFGEETAIDFFVPVSQSQKLLAALTECTNGKVLPVENGEKFVMFEE